MEPQRREVVKNFSGMDERFSELVAARIRVTGASSEIDFPVLLPAAPKAVRFNDLERILAEVKNESW